MKKLLCIITLMVSFHVAFAQNIIEHIVASGETIESIAQRYGISASDITALNPNAAKFIYVGMKLQIKTIPATPQPAAQPAQTPAPQPAQQPKQEPVQQEMSYVMVIRPYVEPTFDISPFCLPMGDIYDIYNRFNFGQHYSIGAKLFFTDNLFASAAFEYIWISLNGSRDLGNYHSKEISSFSNFLGVPLKIGYGGGSNYNGKNRYKFGINAGFWIGGCTGTTYKEGSGKNKTKTHIKGTFYWAPTVALSYGFMSVEYRPMFAKGSDDALHTIGLVYSF